MKDLTPLTFFQRGRWQRTIRGGAGNDIINAGSGDDTIFGEEGNDRLFGHSGDDLISGGLGDDWIEGESGDDVLRGDEGNDILLGGAGKDVLTGGAGVDTLTGNAGADIFVLQQISDSGVCIGNRDTITDFAKNADQISLVSIDANTTTAGDQAFTFIATAAFSGSAGQLRFTVAGWQTIVEGDVDGDAVADFQVQLTGIVKLVADHFVL